MFVNNCDEFELLYREKKDAIAYVKKNWFSWKEKFVSAWTEKHLHFGNRSSSRAKGAHAKLKLYLQVSTGGFKEVCDKLCLVVKHEFNKIKVKLASEKIKVLHNCNKPVYRKLLYHVSQFALKEICKQYEKITKGTMAPCTGHFTLLDVLNAKYQAWPLHKKEIATMMITNLISQSDMLFEPVIQRPRGRPPKSKKKKGTTSTTRNPSRFEYVESVQKHNPSSSSNVVQRRNEETNVVSYIRHENNMIDLNLYPDFPSSCRFGRDCHYVHDPNAKTNDISNSKQSTNSTDALLVKILEKLGLNYSGTSRDSNTNCTSMVAPYNVLPVAYTANSVPSPYLYSAQPVGPVHTFMQPVHPLTPPPGFHYPLAQPSMAHQAATQPTHAAPLGYQILGQAAQQPTQPAPTGSARTGDLYPVTAPSPIPHVFLINQHTWHQRLGHPGREVLRHLVSYNFISYNKEKPPVLCHACQLGKHVRLPFVSSNTVVTSRFDLIHSDV
ncbi:protein FAR1-related sequence 5 [Tanacetum coccineum]